MAKQTALQWFINGLLESNYITKDSVIMNGFIEEAKAMEKEQIVAARMNGMTDDELSYVNAETYYNETYKN